MLTTLPPQRTGGAPARGEAAPFLGRYNDALKGMAGKKDARIVDLYALIPLSLVGEDGLHLTPAPPPPPLRPPVGPGVGPPARGGAGADFDFDWTSTRL